MPLLELTLPPEALAGHDLDELMGALAEVLLRWERAPSHSEIVREITWCYVHRAEGMTLAGRTPPQPRFRIDVTLPAGMLDDQAKAGITADLTETFAQGIGDEAPDFAFRTWCLIHEIPDGNWGANGRIYRRKDIIDLALGRPDAPPKG